MSVTIKELNNIGFDKAGSWLKSDVGIEVELINHVPKSSVLYLFVVDNVIKYVGKTVRTLRKRMYGYKKPGSTQWTNLRINSNIIDCLDRGQSVDIYVWYDKEPKKHGNLIDINLAAGLEDSLIRLTGVRHEWNKR